MVINISILALSKMSASSELLSCTLSDAAERSDSLNLQIIDQSKQPGSNEISETANELYLKCDADLRNQDTYDYYSSLDDDQILLSSVDDCSSSDKNLTRKSTMEAHPFPDTPLQSSSDKILSSSSSPEYALSRSKAKVVLLSPINPYCLKRKLAPKDKPEASDNSRGPPKKSKFENISNRTSYLENGKQNTIDLKAQNVSNNMSDILTSESINLADYKNELEDDKIIDFPSSPPQFY
ncbi:hypothetical protein V1511DRAFT_499443 [Dipodascopsis uninucleata]